MKLLFPQARAQLAPSLNQTEDLVRCPILEGIGVAMARFILWCCNGEARNCLLQQCRSNTIYYGKDMLGQVDYLRAKKVSPASRSIQRARRPAKYNKGK